VRVSVGNSSATAAGGLRSPRKAMGPSALDFDPATLPDDARLTTPEVAAWTRFACVSLEKWRAARRRGVRRGPDFENVEGAVRYRVGAVREWLAEGSRSQERGAAENKGPGESKVFEGGIARAKSAESIGTEAEPVVTRKEEPPRIRRRLDARRRGGAKSQVADGAIP
jgi:hypothetical protein